MVSLFKSEIAFLGTQCCTKVIQRVLRIAIFFCFLTAVVGHLGLPSRLKEFHLQFIPTEFD